jgi:acyl-CoA thioester hydrolase
MEHHRKLVYSNQMPIRWGDQDAMGHVNNTVYFRYMEQTRIEWLESFGFGTSVTQTEGPVIVNASCTFLIPGHLSGHHRVPDVLRPCRAQQRADLLRDARVGEDRGSMPKARPSWCGSIHGTGKSIPLPEPMRCDSV